MEKSVMVVKRLQRLVQSVLRIAILVVVGAIASCSSSTVNGPATQTTEAAADSSTSTASTTPPAGPSIPDASAPPTSNARDSSNEEPRRILDAVFAVDGDDLRVGFPGFPGPPEFDPCGTDFELTVDASETAVDVVVFERTEIAEAFPGLICDEAEASGGAPLWRG